MIGFLLLFIKDVVLVLHVAFCRWGKYIFIIIIMMMSHPLLQVCWNIWTYSGTNGVETYIKEKRNHVIMSPISFLLLLPWLPNRIVFWPMGIYVGSTSMGVKFVGSSSSFSCDWHFNYVEMRTGIFSSSYWDSVLLRWLTGQERTKPGARPMWHLSHTYNNWIKYN